jgi:hypothetical protein
MTTDLDIPVAERLAKLIRLLGSDREGEVLAAAAALKRVLKENGSDLHDFADRLTAERETKPLDKAFADGFRAGYHAAEEDAPTGNVVAEWHDIAKYCAAQIDRLQPHERDFVEQMVGWTRRGREPSEKQGRWLDGLYSRLQRHERKRKR